MGVPGTTIDLDFEAAKEVPVYSMPPIDDNLGARRVLSVPDTASEDKASLCLVTDDQEQLLACAQISDGEVDLFLLDDQEPYQTVGKLVTIAAIRAEEESGSEPEVVLHAEQAPGLAEKLAPVLGHFVNNASEMVAFKKLVEESRVGIYA